MFAIVDNVLTRRVSVCGICSVNLYVIIEIQNYLKTGFVGENRNGYLQVLNANTPADKQPDILVVVKQENKDRKIIYQATAEKNGANLAETQKVFFQNHYKRAPSGYWFEVYDQEKGKYKWVQK